MAERSPAQGRGETRVRSSLVSVITSGGIFRSQPYFSRARLILTQTTLDCALGDGQRTETVAECVHSYLLEDVVGVEVIDLPLSHSKTACQMNVHVYPKKTDRRNPKKSSRKMTVLSVCFDGGETHGENREDATRWKEAIKLHSYCRCQKVLHNPDSAADSNAELSEVPRRHLLVLINPMSGLCRGVEEFQRRVQPLFEIAEITFNVVVTECRNHARDLIKEYDLSSVDGIVIASGDGLLYEVVNGMMEREDWEEALKTPIGMLPTGSGNALCASTLYEAGEEFSLVNATFQIIQGGVIPMDITTVQTADGQTLYMTILSGWGMVADIDIESEKLRKIGDTRFILGALNCIRKKRIYQGRLRYLPYDDSENVVSPVSHSIPTGSSLRPASANQATSSLKPEELMWATDRGQADTTETPDQGPLLASGEKGEEKHQLTEKAVDGVREEKGGKNSVCEFVRDDKDTPTAQTSETAHSNISTPRSHRSSGPKPHLLPNIAEATPDDWKVVEGEFLAINSLMIPHLSSTFFGDHRVSIGMGKIRILYIRKMSRFGMLGILSGGGPNLNKPEIECIDVKAFRLEPHTEDGILTVDGEVVKYGAMQAQVHQHLARVFCCKRIVH